ncbi:hypothetical protein BC940DRAFT_306392 [Gongronella butleri]|nr:hypothetical protein BC940DRAFT_306392 [Gongronella butleri]
MKVLFLLALFVGIVLANSHCGKNAWIHWRVTAYNDLQYGAQVSITSGKGANDISDETLEAAFADCANAKHPCFGSKDYVYCKQNGEQTTPRWSGSGNIEFSCSDGPYTCYDFAWYIL